MSYRDSFSSGYRGSRRGTIVYVGDIPRSARQEDIEKAFRYYGNVRHCWISTNPWGYGFVEYYDPKDAEDSIRGLDGKSFAGGRLRVEISHGKGRTRGGTVSTPRYPPPRRHYPNSSSYDRYGHSHERAGHSSYHNSRKMRSRSRSRERTSHDNPHHQHSQRSISRSRSASRDRNRSNGSRDKSSKNHSTSSHHHKSSRHHKKSKKSRKSRSRSKSATPSERREKLIEKSNSPKSNNDDLNSLISDNSLPSTLNGDGGHTIKETGSNHDLSYESVSNTEIVAN